MFKLNLRVLQLCLWLVYLNYSRHPGMWVAMVWVNSGSLERVSEVSTRLNQVGVEFGDIAVSGVPVVVLIHPCYCIVNTDLKTDYSWLKIDMQIFSCTAWYLHHYNLNSSVSHVVASKEAICYANIMQIQIVKSSYQK